MNQLIETNKLTMSSLEIAELTGKLHKNVLADIRAMLSEIGSAEKLADYKDGQGRTYPMLLLNREETDCLITGYSAKLRMIVIKRWHELESNKNALPDFTNPIEAARAWADQYEAKEIAQQALIEAKPKIDYFERVSLNAAHLNATQVGKKVGMSATALNKHLNDLGVYNKSVKRSRVFKQWFIDEGFGEVKTADNGYTQSVFTIKGEQKVIEMLTSEGII